MKQYLRNFNAFLAIFILLEFAKMKIIEDLIFQELLMLVLMLEIRKSCLKPGLLNRSHSGMPNLTLNLILRQMGLTQSLVTLRNTQT